MKEGRKVGGIGDFLAGKGFYIILFVCVAVIGVSAWILLFTSGGEAPVGPEMLGAVEFPTGATPDYGSHEVVAPTVPDSHDVFATQPGAASPPPSETPSNPPEESPVQETLPPKPQEASSEDGAHSGAPEKTLGEMTYVWPVAGDVERIFAIDELIYSRTMADWRVHPGIDITAALGAKVTSVTDGEVTDVFEDDMMGTTVVIDHGHGLKSIYSNLAVTPVVKKGDKISLGAVIGAVGDTAQGEIGEVSHLHFEMTLDGEPVDPVGFLPTI